MSDEEKNMPPEQAPDFDDTVLKDETSVREGGPPRDKAPYLVVAQGPRQGIRFPLRIGDNTIGRAMGVEVLLEDQSVSRKHAIISQTREGWTVEDSGSKNGTYVDGQRILEKVTIGHGDVIQTGVYTLRLITKAVSKEEEVGPLPPDWEGKTLMMSGSPDDETRTQVEKEEEAKAAAGEEAEAEAEGEAEGEEKAIAIPEEDSKAKKKRPVWFKILLIVVLVLVVGAAATFAYFEFFHKPPKPVKPAKPPVATEETKTPATELKPPEPKPVELPPTVPVFLDFASSPLPAKVTFQGKEIGTTPIKIQDKLDVGKTYTAEAEFDLKEIGEKYKEEATFTVSRDESLIPVLFKGPFGVLKVLELPKDTQLYLEGYFIYDPFNAKTAKLDSVVFGKPVYIPYGKYVIELRQEKELAGSGEFMKDIRYRREILVSEDSPIFELKIGEKDLEEFPIEIESIPTNADVFIDAVKVGKTPYKGIFPLGDHTLSLRKEGYFEHKQEIRMEKNVPVKMEIPLKTTVSGEAINLGKHLMQKGRYQDAIAKLSEVFKQSPTEGEVAQARYLIGSSYVHLGDLSTAEGYFKQSVENDEMRYPSMLGLVSVYHGLGRKDEAIPNLVEVLLNAKDETIKKEAYTLFQQISPLRSIMYIHTDPEGAAVYLNDKPIEQTTPVILPDLSLGNYKVRIEKAGYIPQDLSINISVNEFNPVVVKLKPIPE